jgi:hypothetical protein
LNKRGAVQHIGTQPSFRQSILFENWRSATIASHGAPAAELTNHLVDRAVLIPGAAGTLPELQQAGFHYAK